MTISQKKSFLHSLSIHIIRKQVEISSFRRQYRPAIYIHIIHDLSAVVTEDLSSDSGSAATLPTPVINCDGRRVAYFYIQTATVSLSITNVILSTNTSKVCVCVTPPRFDGKTWVLK